MLPSPDEQPSLSEGDLLLRPWRLDDAETTRRLDDEASIRWFAEVGSPAPPAAHRASWVEQTHAAWADGRARASFLVEHHGVPVGSVQVRVQGPRTETEGGVGVVSYLTYAPYRGNGLASRALRLLVDWAFSQAGLGLHRVEARVGRPQSAAVRTALRSGLRREGVLRGGTTIDGRFHDTEVFGRLVDDPKPGTREGFTAMLNSQLPTKRVIAQGLIRNSVGAILLCELAYKRDWDLPGGVVDPDESPATCLVREIREELSIDVELTGLLAVNWLKPYLGWDDAVLFVFEVAPVGDDVLSRAHLLERELKGAHWVDPAQAAEHVAPYNARMLASLEAAGVIAVSVTPPSVADRTGAAAAPSGEFLADASRATLVLEDGLATTGRG